MRTARLVGLSPDGDQLIVATESGEQMTMVADDRLRAALRGDRPRLGQLEIEMDSALSPRDIQTRIRSGESLADVTKVAGIPLDRVERFAAPVLAERDHVARLAMAASVRRRGETSGHRNLRVALTERLLARGVDIDTIDWNSYRTEGGRWAITADYKSGESERQAMFLFDLQGRFSVAGNEEARWVLGEHSSAKGPQPGRKRAAVEGDDNDTEPTLDLSDELALVRVVQDPPEPAPPAQLASVQDLRPRTAAPAAVQLDSESEPGEEPTPAEVQPSPDEPDPLEGAEPVEVDAAEDDPLLDEPPAQATASELDQLYDMMGGDGYAEDSTRVYSGLSDATAVPEISTGGWEPAIVVNYPVEPSRVEALEPVSDHTPVGPEATLPDEPPTVQPLDEPPVEIPPNHQPPPEPPAQGQPDVPDEAPPVPRPGTDVPGPPDEPTDIGDRRVEEDTFQLQPEPAVKKPAKRKRASVPSWDEIMFGGPKRQG